VPGYLECVLAQGGAFHVVAATESDLFRALAVEGRLGAPPPRTLAECVEMLARAERERSARWRRAAVAGADFTARQAATAHGARALAGARGRTARPPQRGPGAGARGDPSRGREHHAGVPLRDAGRRPRRRRWAAVGRRGRGSVLSGGLECALVPRPGRHGPTRAPGRPEGECRLLPGLGPRAPGPDAGDDVGREARLPLRGAGRRHAAARLVAVAAAGGEPAAPAPAARPGRTAGGGRGARPVHALRPAGLARRRRGVAGLARPFHRRLPAREPAEPRGAGPGARLARGAGRDSGRTGHDARTRGAAVAAAGRRGGPATAALGSARPPP